MKDTVTLAVPWTWWWRHTCSCSGRSALMCPLDKNPMPGHLSELQPVNEEDTKKISQLKDIKNLQKYAKKLFQT